MINAPSRHLNAGIRIRKSLNWSCNSLRLRLRGQCGRSSLVIPKLTPRLFVEGSPRKGGRSEAHTSELQSLMRISYAVFCLKKTNILAENHHHHTHRDKQ